MAKIAAPMKVKPEGKDVGRRRVEIVACEIRHGRAQRRDLGEREVDEDHPALDDVDPR
jgi:hypothetical protein